MENSNKIIWKKWWLWAIVILLIIIILYNITNIEEDNINQNNNEKNINASTNEEIEVQENEYAEDDIVNSFIKDFKSTSSYELTDIEKGNIRTKYFANINGQYCEFLNSTKNLANCFAITIYGGNKNEDINKIVNVYKEVIKTLDSTISETDIDNLMMKHIKNPSSSFNITEDITVKLYPIVDLSYGKSDCRIEITTTIYN